MYAKGMSIYFNLYSLVVNKCIKCMVRTKQYYYSSLVCILLIITCLFMFILKRLKIIVNIGIDAK